MYYKQPSHVTYHNVFHLENENWMWVVGKKDVKGKFVFEIDNTGFILDQVPFGGNLTFKITKMRIFISPRALVNKLAALIVFSGIHNNLYLVHHTYVPHGSGNGTIMCW